MTRDDWASAWDCNRLLFFSPASLWFFWFFSWGGLTQTLLQHTVADNFISVEERVDANGAFSLGEMQARRLAAQPQPQLEQQYPLGFEHLRPLPEQIFGKLYVGSQEPLRQFTDYVVH